MVHGHDRPDHGRSRAIQVGLRQNQTFGYTGRVTWGELIRRLKAAGFVEARAGKGSHRQLVHPKTGQVITIAVHTKKEVGTGLAAKILKEAGL
jgi:predicted RNA binding protein YcfA (HicA-like mRNA interferase family)